MFATDRLANEQAFHDRQALARRIHFSAHPGDLEFTDEAYLNHEPWIRPAFAMLGDVSGLRVLDYGCGHGMASVILSRRGAKVVAFDLSGAYAEEAGLRSQANHVGTHVTVVQANAEQLPFATASFDRIWGNAILHHLDLFMAGKELARVLKPGGIAVFCEPWGENWLLEWTRRQLPYPGKCRSRDEKPLQRAQLELLQQQFRDMALQPFQLLGMVRRVWRSCPILPALDRWDGSLVRHWPALGNFCRYLVLSFRR